MGQEKIKGLKLRLQPAGGSEDYKDVALDGNPQNMVQVSKDLNIREKGSG